MFRMRLLAFVLFLGVLAGFGSGFRHLAGGGWHGPGGWHHGGGCERAAAETAP